MTGWSAAGTCLQLALLIVNVDRNVTAVTTATSLFREKEKRCDRMFSIFSGAEASCPEAGQPKLGRGEGLAHSRASSIRATARFCPRLTLVGQVVTAMALPRRRYFHGKCQKTSSAFCLPSTCFPSSLIVALSQATVLQAASCRRRARPTSLQGSGLVLPCEYRICIQTAAECGVECGVVGRISCKQEEGRIAFGCLPYLPSPLTFTHTRWSAHRARSPRPPAPVARTARHQITTLEKVCRGVTQTSKTSERNKLTQTNFYEVSRTVLRAAFLGILLADVGSARAVGGDPLFPYEHAVHWYNSLIDQSQRIRLNVSGQTPYE